ncbi:flagellar basal body L-ring protein FlgH [Stakelama sediminis]|uniref:Flagellar L-ring protein n=1 Tax=Stakelama sediminis TaxID=463200 RepID=A0A840YWT0_9SPHN|nr:flagellar basal body L-ring protein FlgH [Stakelama sediminis]MBB5718010.1 flagellar L-ring protein precursor FlgH [Stakelama sediminis]
MAAGAMLAATVGAPAPAHAGIFGKKKKHDSPEFATVLPSPPPAAPANGAIFQASNGYAGLYSGNRAAAVGDPVTIVLTERTSASKSAGSNLDSSGGVSLVPPTTGLLNLFNKTDASASGSRGFKGTGTADQSNALTGEITVTVAQVYPNGTMLVQGRKKVTLNRGDEWLEIRGIVRSADIDQYNRIPSTRVADAQIAYTGKGDVARASRQGWLSRFFQIISPF